MTRMIKTAITFLIQSISHSLPYLVLGSLVDSRLYNVFMLVYPFQFLSMIVATLCENIGTRAIVRDNGEHNSAEAMSARGLGAVGYLIFILVSIPLVIVIAPYYVDFSKLDNWYIKPVICGYIVYQSYSVTWLYSIFEDICGNHKKAMIISIKFLLISIITILISLIFKIDSINIMYLSMALNIILILHLVIQNKHYFKNMRLEYIKNISSGVPSMISYIFLTATYLIGIFKSSTAGLSEIATLSSIVLFFDCVWDAQYCIAEHYNSLAERGNKLNALKLSIRRGILVTLILSVLPLSITVLNGINSENIQITIIELAAFLLYGLCAPFKAYSLSEYKIKYCNLLIISIASIRVITTGLIPSEYSSEISLIVTYAIHLPIMIALCYITNRRKKLKLCA